MKKIIIFVGPSGSGKTAIMTEYKARHPDVYIAPSVTTRPKRPEDVDYVHVTEDAFEALSNSGSMLEESTYAGYRYGTMKTTFADCTAPIAMKAMNLDGAKSVEHAMGSGVALVFVDRPIHQCLDAMLGRDCVKDDKYFSRSESAYNEAETAREECCYRIDNSRDLAYAVDQLERIIELIGTDVNNHLKNLRLMSIFKEDWCRIDGEMTLYFHVHKMFVDDIEPDAVYGTLALAFPVRQPEVLACEASLSPTVESEDGTTLVDTDWVGIDLDAANTEYLLSFYDDDGEEY